MRKTFLFLFLWSNFLFATAQQDRALLLYNIGFGGFTSSIGAVINKPKGVDWKKAFVSGFWQGSIGGALNYTGKKSIYLIHHNRQLWYGWPSKLFQAAGTSIMENAALGEPFLQNWNIDYGPLRIDFSLKEGKGAKVRLLPVGIYALIKSSRGATFDLKTTLLTGNVAFKSKRYYVMGASGDVKGTAHGRAFVWADQDDMYEVISHEIMHLYQYREHLVFSAWLKKLASGVKNKALRQIFDRYVYPDIPFFWGFYNLQPYDPNRYYRNFYEFEAERFSTNRYISR